MGLLTFGGGMFLLLVVAFCCSYLFWSDRTKTPEIIAAEVGFVSERIGSISLSGLILLSILVLSLMITNAFPLSFA